MKATVVLMNATNGIARFRRIVKIGDLDAFRYELISSNEVRYFFRITYWPRIVELIPKKHCTSPKRNKAKELFGYSPIKAAGKGKKHTPKRVILLMKIIFMSIFFTRL